MTDFSDNLKWLRKARGLTQAELAKKIRVHRRPTTASYISRLESGDIDPRLSTLRSIARALRVRPWILLASIIENTDFWQQYLALSPEAKRDIQRQIEWKSKEAPLRRG